MKTIQSEYSQTIKKKLISLCFWILITIIFSLTFTQNALYDGNQNTKFVYGMKDAGVGLLHEDWLANTADPLPLFSLLIRITYNLFNEYFIYLYFIIFLGIYIYSLLGISGEIQKDEQSKFVLYTIFCVLLLIHSKAAKVILHSYIFTQGVAGQYITSYYFQNSIFGVLLFLSIFLFLKKKYYGAIISIGISCLFHTAYLFTAGLLTFSYMLIIFLETKKIKQPILLGLTALALVLPAVIYNRIHLGATNPDIWNKAIDIIIYERIPHHSLPAAWFDFTNVIQIAFICFALVLARKTRIFFILLIPFAGGLVFSLIQIIFNSNFLAFLAPWRVSVLLVPLATLIIIYKCIRFIFFRFKTTIQKYDKTIKMIIAVMIGCLCLSGIFLQYYYCTKHHARNSTQLTHYVKEHKASGDVYLIPSNDEEFERFRLFTGAPVFVTWKSHPYKDKEVIEWYNRYKLAETFYNAAAYQTCNKLQDIMYNYTITHIIIDKEKIPLQCKSFTIIYEDNYYILYRLSKNTLN